jgi:hypothetical protein
MIISVSAVALLGAVLWLLVRHAGLRLLHALVAALFGFFVASTTAAPQINAVLTNLTHVLGGR